MSGVLSLVTAPAALAVDWDNDLKKHIRLDSEDDRDYIENVLVPSATDRVEAVTNRQLITATWKLFLSCFPDADILRLPKAPLVSVTHVKYYDTAGTLTTWPTSSYEVFAPAGPKAAAGHIRPAYGEIWPSTWGEPNAVEIQFVCGYGTASDNVPGSLRHAIVLNVAEGYENREESIKGTIMTPALLRADNLALPFLVEV